MIFVGVGSHTSSVRLLGDIKSTFCLFLVRNCLVGLDAKRSYHDQKAKARKQYTEKVKYELQYIQEKIISLEPLSFRFVRLLCSHNK